MKLLLLAAAKPLTVLLGVLVGYSAPRAASPVMIEPEPIVPPAELRAEPIEGPEARIEIEVQPVERGDIEARDEDDE